MDVKEKLVKLLENHCAVIGEDHCKASQSGECATRDCAICLASDLIANGVTVQEWIPVTERLPDKDGDYLVFKRFAGNAWSDVVSFAQDGRKVGECAFGEKWQNVWYYYDSEWGYMMTDAVTHWMPLPQPPKGE